MIHLSSRRTAHRTSFFTSLLLALSLFFAATIGDQVEFRATHPAGVPFHQAPGGTPKFQRVPSGTVGSTVQYFDRTTNK